MSTATKRPIIGEVQDTVEILRQILIKEQHREITYIEAVDIGNSLIEFYELLAGAS